MKALSNREVFEVIVNLDWVIGEQSAKLPNPSKSPPLPLINQQKCQCRWPTHTAYKSLCL
jgi:hypothetical protein